MMLENLIGIDFDDTIYCVENKRDIKGAIEAIKELRKAGYQPYVFTANPDHDFIIKFMHEKGIDNIMVSSQKIHSKYYIDDRAIAFRDNWGDIVKKIVKKSG